MAFKKFFAGFHNDHFLRLCIHHICMYIYLCSMSPTPLNNNDCVHTFIRAKGREPPIFQKKRLFGSFIEKVCRILIGWVCFSVSISLRLPQSKLRWLYDACLQNMCVCLSNKHLPDALILMESKLHVLIRAPAHTLHMMNVWMHM